MSEITDAMRSRTVSRLQNMTRRQMERLAEDIGFVFDDRGRGKIATKDMLKQLSVCDAVVGRLGGC